MINEKIKSTNVPLNHHQKAIHNATIIILNCMSLENGIFLNEKNRIYSKKKTHEQLTAQRWLIPTNMTKHLQNWDFCIVSSVERSADVWWIDVFNIG